MLIHIFKKCKCFNDFQCQIEQELNKKHEYAQLGSHFEETGFQKIDNSTNCVVERDDFKEKEFSEKEEREVRLIQQLNE